MRNGRFFFAITLKTMKRGIYNFSIFGVFDDSLYIKGISTCKSTGNDNKKFGVIFKQPSIYQTISTHSSTPS